MTVTGSKDQTGWLKSAAIRKNSSDSACRNTIILTGSSCSAARYSRRRRIAINRVPAKGDARSNMHAGGKAVASELTDRDREICARIGPELKRRGFILVGIDVIGDYLTEINVTSPTGLQEIARFDGVHLERAIWDAIEARR